MSWSISNNEGLDTVLADLDLAFGCAGLNFNQEALPGLTDVLGQPDRVDAMLIERMLIKISDRLNLLSGPGGFERDFQIEPHAIEALFAAMRSSVPYLILDLPAHWAPWTKFALQNAEQVVITTTPDLPGLRNAKNLVDQLMELRPNDQPPVLVINQVGVPKRPEIKAAEFSKAIGIAVAAVIPFDAQSFGNAQTNGQTIFEVSPKSKSASSIESLARSLTGLGKERQYDGKPAGSLIDKLLGRSRET